MSKSDTVLRKIPQAADNQRTGEAGVRKAGKKLEPWFG